MIVFDIVAGLEKTVSLFKIEKLPIAHVEVVKLSFTALIQFENATSGPESFAELSDIGSSGKLPWAVQILVKLPIALNSKFPLGLSPKVDKGTLKQNVFPVKVVGVVIVPTTLLPWKIFNVILFSILCRGSV